MAGVRHAAEMRPVSIDAGRFLVRDGAIGWPGGLVLAFAL
jgi:hypothetical protein